MDIENQPSRTLESLYLKGKYIANGSFGYVWEGTSIIDPSKKVAIKEIDRRKFQAHNQEILLKTINRQIQYNIKLKETKCPFIVEFIDHFETQHIVYLVFEYCQDTLGRLIDLNSDSSQFSKREYILIKVLYQMLLTLRVLQGMHLIHRDIKPQNILINKGITKLGDFGFCRQLNKNLTSGRGSLRTTAPEAHTSTFYNKCDIWSLGVTIHNCLYQIQPFSQKLRSIQDPLSFRNIIVSKQFEVQIRRESRLSQVLQKMIVIEEQQRSSVSELLEHPIFKIDKLTTTAQWIRSWLLFSSLQEYQGKQLDSTILAIVAVAFSQCKVYYQVHKTKGKPIFMFALTFCILQLFIKMLLEMNAFSPQNMHFVRAISVFYDRTVIQGVLKSMRTSHKSAADNIDKLLLYISSGAQVTSKLVQIRALYQSKAEDQVNKLVASKYPEFVIFPKINQLIEQSNKLRWGINNIISLATKKPLQFIKQYFKEREEYHEHIPLF